MDRRPRYPLALSRTLFRRSLLAGALVALGISVNRRSPDPHAQVVVSHFVFRPHPSHQPRRHSGQVENDACFSVKRQVFFYPCFIGRIEHCTLREMALALCTFGRQQMSTARVATQDFTGRRYLKAFRHRLFGFASRDRFWHREPGTYTVEATSQQESTRRVQCRQSATLYLLKSEKETGTGIILTPSPLRARDELPELAPSFPAPDV